MRSTNKLPWTEKYRPSNLDQIMSHTEIKLALKSFIQSNSMPNILFSGPTGSGKTSAIKACAKEMFGDFYNYMVMEINASSERGIDVVRNKINTFSVSNVNSLIPENTRQFVKLVILDETDSMTHDAQLLLRQVIEKYNTRYCIICNDIDKIDIALQSRCAHFRFYPLSVDDMLTKLGEIVNNEGLICDEKSLRAIIIISKGDMRAAINILQHVSLTRNKKISEKDIYNIVGHCRPKIIHKIFDELCKLGDENITLNDTVTKIYDIVVDNNVTISNLLDTLHKLVMDSDYDVKQKIFIVNNLSKCQIYDSVNVDTKIIIMNISSIFILIN